MYTCLSNTLKHLGILNKVTLMLTCVPSPQKVNFNLISEFAQLNFYNNFLENNLLTH